MAFACTRARRCPTPKEPPAGAPSRAASGRRAGALRHLLASGLALLLLAGEAAAPAAAPFVASSVIATEAQARSSGGYFRPHFSGRSFGGFHVRSRTPSFSGGYRRPSGSGLSTSRRPSFGGGAGDRAFSRQRSGEALRSYRNRSSTSSRPVGNSGGWGTARNSYRTSTAGRWYANRGWNIPHYAWSGPRHFGLWNGLFLWFLLSHLSRPGSAAFFYNHQNDPGYQQWRAEAESKAQDDPAVRQQLNQLDQKLADKQGQPRDPNYLPPGVPHAVATGDGTDARTPGVGPGTGGGSGVIWVVLLGGGAFAFLAWRRAHPSLAGRAPAQPTASRPMGSKPGRLGSLGAMLRHKLSGDDYTPQHFRVGMTVTCDPTPFLLAAGATKVPKPDTGGGNLLTNVQGLGRAGEGAAQLLRLYLPGWRSMFQLHLDRAGNPDECRYFGLIDEVMPADASEWGAWLDPAEGMIGWPEFQTKDGKIYGRAWAPGPSRIPPGVLPETIETTDGTQARTSQAMLYAAPTGLAQPAPQTEYILVAAVEAGQQAWVQIWAGIDINPATLSLA